MIITDEVVLRGIIFILTVCGFFISKHIHTGKQKAEPLVCPMNFNCHAVVHSEYSSFFGINLEVFGMIYYALVALLYLALMFVVAPLPFFLSISLVVLATGAFLFSIYLTLVQLVILKEGCFWCFVSAFISLIVFVIAVFLYDLGPIIRTLLS
ncbi:MAG: hypothetical protein KBD55_01360 [Candidatus Pacebacteria bacterium]|jgi:uncharacterized membrane protein|nr:hypothetical protein [Candidatus Paceibacterota bacterium]